MCTDIEIPRVGREKSCTCRLGIVATGHEVKQSPFCVGEFAPELQEAILSIEKVLQPLREEDDGRCCKERRTQPFKRRTRAVKTMKPNLLGNSPRDLKSKGLYEMLDAPLSRCRGFLFFCWFLVTDPIPFEFRVSKFQSFRGEVLR